MSHLDEGMLHAFLDNALPTDAEQHLLECAECRANLEKARELKESADTILAGAAPAGVAMPSFDELQARAKLRGANSEAGDGGIKVARQRRFPQLRALAWAATVVLAVAVGWYARPTVLQIGRDQLASEGETVGRLTIPLPETDAAEMEESPQVADLNEVASGQDAPNIIAGVTDAADQGVALEALRATVSDTAEAVAQIREALEVSAAPPQPARVEPTVTTVAATAGETRQDQQATRSVPRIQPQ